MTEKIGLYSKMFTSLLLTAAYGKQYKKDGAEKRAKAEIGRRKNMFAGLLVVC